MIKLALLWHMHQPYYEDLATGEHILPWVRLHATKDYWGMVALLREFPQVRVTFNLVPSLLVQVEAFAADRAQDRHLRVGLAPAEDLAADDRRFLVANGFHAPFDCMIRPLPRYAALHAARHHPDSFTVGDLRDLQVLHKLVWMDPDALASDARLAALVAKGRDFTEADKQQLRIVELELLNAVIPAYRAAHATGRVELTTSPFYHPILPLLCETDAHFHAHPRSTLPPGTFVRPDDAREQLQRAFAYHAQTFGAAPRGVWPSEGSLSDQVVELLAACGAEWTATDEEILARSLGRSLTASDLYRPYALGTSGRPVRACFRDHELSDLIGFAYQSWEAEAASSDFVARVRDAGRRFRDAGGEGDPVVTVILDGENAWEHYPGGGRPFLRALYRELERADDICTVTMSEAAGAEARPLRSVFPGSWIHGDFYIWAGHRDDHAAWAQLAAARQAFDDFGAAVDADARGRAWEELLIAEGSDWFWWYGDDHSSDHDREFDDLFRRHLRNVYRWLGQTAPADLHRTNITTAPVPDDVRLDALTSPAIDGHGADFTQWSGSVEVPLAAGGGAMHRVSGGVLQSVRVAADREYLYLRLEGKTLSTAVTAGQLRVVLLQEAPPAARVELARRDQMNPGYAAGLRWRAQEFVTAAVPFALLGGRPGDRLVLTLVLTDAAGQPVETPTARFRMVVPTAGHAARHWCV